MLGFPIVNDTMYGGGREEEGGIADGGGTDDHAGPTADPAATGAASTAPPLPAGTSTPTPPSPTAAAGPAQGSAETAAEALCVCCTRGEAAAFSEEQLRRSGIMLHALRYDFVGEGARLSLEVGMPGWGR